MRKKLFLLLVILFLMYPVWAQLGKYSINVSSSITPVWSCNSAITYTFCVDLTNFNQSCGGSTNWIDAVEFRFGGNWEPGTLTYLSQPNSNWKNAITSTDEPAGWYGWSFNNNAPNTKTWNDIGDNITSGSFCFSVQSAAALNPCWGTTCNYAIDCYIWGDGDTGGRSSGNCPTKGVPDGPYSIINQSCTNSLPIELLYFKCSRYYEDNRLSWRTAFESNLDNFIVEVSADLTTWYGIFSVPAINLMQVSDYQLFTSIETHYYRLSSKDLNGLIKQLKTIDCWNNQIEAELIVDVFTTDGRFILTKVLESSLKQLLAPGVYIIRNFTGQTKIIQI